MAEEPTVATPAMLGTDRELDIVLLDLEPGLVNLLTL